MIQYNMSETILVQITLHPYDDYGGPLLFQWALISASEWEKIQNNKPKCILEIHDDGQYESYEFTKFDYRVITDQAKIDAFRLLGEMDTRLCKNDPDTIGSIDFIGNWL